MDDPFVHDTSSYVEDQPQQKRVRILEKAVILYSGLVVAKIVGCVPIHISTMEKSQFMFKTSDVDETSVHLWQSKFNPGVQTMPSIAIHQWFAP